MPKIRLCPNSNGREKFCNGHLQALPSQHPFPWRASPLFSAPVACTWLTQPQQQGSWCNPGLSQAVSIHPLRHRHQDKGGKLPKLSVESKCQDFSKSYWSCWGHIRSPKVKPFLATVIAKRQRILMTCFEPQGQRLANSSQKGLHSKYFSFASSQVSLETIQCCY